MFQFFKKKTYKDVKPEYRKCEYCVNSKYFTVYRKELECRLCKRVVSYEGFCNFFKPCEEAIEKSNRIKSLKEIGYRNPELKTNKGSDTKMKFICNKEVEGRMYKVFELNESEEISQCEKCDIKKIFNCEEEGKLPCLGLFSLDKSIGKSFILKEIIKNPIKLTIVTSIQNIDVSVADVELEKELADKILKDFDYISTAKFDKAVDIYQKSLNNIKISIFIKKTTE